MDGRRGRRGWMNQTLLPLRTARNISNSVSCWYCDLKFLVFNEPLFKFGRRYARYLRIWFSMGTGFTFAALFGVTLILLFEFSRLLLVYVGNPWLASSSVFGPFTLITRSKISISSTVYMCISSFISVLVHEMGHALAAASEGVHLEYVAVFLAVLFPGALVAFNEASLQALPALASLRVYCAGIWHNAAVCAVSIGVLFLLPYVLHPLYTYGESPMVLDVPPSSPLSGYLSLGDVIVSLDGTHIHTKEEWKHRIVILMEQTKWLDSGQSNGTSNGNNGYCVPLQLIYGHSHIHFEANEANCPNRLSAFTSASCVGSTKHEDDGPDINHQKRRERVHCLDAKEIVKLKKCFDNRMQARTNTSGCLCSRVESCLLPMQLPGQEWVEISFYSLNCERHERHLDTKDSSSENSSCLQTFVFVGDLIAMAYSVHLTSYRPKYFVPFAAYLPDTLEKLFTCLFHVSLLLALLNSLPVFFLDGESILEGIIHHHLCFLNVYKRRLILRCCLLGGTFISVSLFLQTVLANVMGGGQIS